MSISAGTRFGAYEIVEPIGSGGMGEVYRARDTTLGRDVALKVLPASFSNDAQRIARFEQEAKTLASLNQANIAHIYGLERSDGNVGIVMELVDGQTLVERIAQGPIPVDEALRIAAQIADALEAAHERGIVHRDLKPANIKIKLDGTVKVLDFGIAKALDPRFLTGPGPAALTTPAMTEAGMILGTAAYMSPEQARGKFVDQRTDIWAFGCVLYEMLTGKPAFLGEDVTSTLARVLEVPREAERAAAGRLARGSPHARALPREGCAQAHRRHARREARARGHLRNRRTGGGATTARTDDRDGHRRNNAARGRGGLAPEARVAAGAEDGHALRLRAASWDQFAVAHLPTQHRTERRAVRVQRHRRYLRAALKGPRRASDPRHGWSRHRPRSVAGRTRGRLLPRSAGSALESRRWTAEHRSC